MGNQRFGVGAGAGRGPAGALRVALVMAFAIGLGGCAAAGDSASSSTSSSASSAAGASAKAGKPRDPAATAPVDEPNAQLQRFRIRDWSALDDHTIVVTADNGTRYRAETMGPCIGLNFATALAFDTRGGFNQVDRFSSVVLGDGTRCAFRSFDRLKAPAEQALDRYESSEKSAD